LRRLRHNMKLPPRRPCAYLTTPNLSNHDTRTMRIGGVCQRAYAQLVPAPPHGGISLA